MKHTQSITPPSGGRESSPSRSDEPAAGMSSLAISFGRSFGRRAAPVLTMVLVVALVATGALAAPAAADEPAVPVAAADGTSARTAREAGDQAERAERAERAGRARTARWSGYRIGRDGTSGGGWIGGYKRAGRVVYRIDPARRMTRKAARTRYGGAHAAGSVARGKKASTRQRRTAQAAYILSRFGTFRYDTQAAAVDVAVSHLLVGGRYSLRGAKARKRIAQSRDPRKVRSFARSMLREAAVAAGAPRIGLAVTNAAVGGTVRATVQLRDARGRVMREQTVRLSYPGATTQVVKTDQAGTAAASFVASKAGRHPVTATVPELPTWRLAVLTPALVKIKTPKGAKGAKGGKRRTLRTTRLAVAGVKTAAVSRRAATVTVKPTVQITGAATGLRTRPVPGRFTLAGGQPGKRTATVRLFGPTSTAGAATCTGAVAATRKVTVTGNGAYAMPAVTAPAAGFYVWHTAVSGDGVNEPVSACGNPIGIKVQPAIKIVRPDATIDAGDYLRSRVAVSGLPTNQAYSNYATVRIYGPFSSRERIRCSDKVLLRRSNARVTGNGQVAMAPVRAAKAGYYQLLAILPAGTFSTAAVSQCRAAGSIIRAR